MGLSPRPRPQPGVAARQAATALHAAVLDKGKPLDALIDPEAGDAAYAALPPRDRRLARAIVATALRRHGEIDGLLSRLIDRRPRRSGRLMHILAIAAAQILFMDVADHAAGAVALEQIGADRDARHYKSLGNAVLRRLARERDTLLAANGLGRLNTPAWLWQRWQNTYGEATAGRIAAAHLIEPALDLTVKERPELWAERLGGVVLPTGSVRLIASGPIDQLAGYAEGAWWVQDAAAALAAKLLGAVAGKRVADLCAAPGGKTAALATAGARVTAVDVSSSRMKRLAANLKRLELTAETVVADVLAWEPDTAGKEGAFDAILLDAPCTATGTIRRHPDVAWLKRPEDVATLAALQVRMIERAVAWLKPGGILVYCTCSLEHEEGEDQLARVLHRHPDLELVPVAATEIGLAESVTPAGAVRSLPCHLVLDEPRLSGLDGFFIMRLRRRQPRVQFAGARH